MNKLNLDIINATSPYNVVQLEDLPFYFYFHTDFNIDYEISIKPNDAFIRNGAYVLDIINIWDIPSPGDDNLRLTLLAIVEEFFRVNNDVMLYITETKDGKQSFRDRLFIRWFNTFERHDRYFIKTVEGEMEGQKNFMAVISRKDNPTLELSLKEFQETVDFLFD